MASPPFPKMNQKFFERERFFLQKFPKSDQGGFGALDLNLSPQQSGQGRYLPLKDIHQIPLPAGDDHVRLVHFRLGDVAALHQRKGAYVARIDRAQAVGIGDVLQLVLMFAQNAAKLFRPFFQARLGVSVCGPFLHCGFQTAHAFVSSFSICFIIARQPR